MKAVLALADGATFVGEAFGASPKETTGEVVETTGAEQHVPHDQQRPAVAEHLDRHRHWAVLAVGLHRRSLLVVRLVGSDIVLDSLTGAA